MFQRLTKQKQWRSKKFPSNLSKFQICLSNESSTNHRGNSYETSKVSEIKSLKPIKIINACIEVFAVTSMLLQRVINESSMKKQWNMNDSELNTTKTIKNQKCSQGNYQCFKKVSPKNHQRLATKQQWNINVSEIRSKQKVVTTVCIEIIKVLSKMLHRIIND